MDDDLSKFVKCDVFTPDSLSKLMASKLKISGNLLEPAVGNGNLLKYLSLKSYDSIDVYELKPEYIDEIENRTNLNKHTADFIKAAIKTTYDNIIMNPPYIKTQDLSISYRKYLKDNFPILSNGTIDIYYAFIIKCLSLLKTDGVMVAITPNSYLYNKSSMQLRKYLFDNQMIQEIIDFKDKKVFSNASVYCCITIFSKSSKTHLTYNGKEYVYTDLIKNYSLFNISDSSCETLRDICKIRNGIATLRDKIYIHTEKLFDEPCWRTVTNAQCQKYIIYPYHDSVTIEEDLFKQSNPKTYAYLVDRKDELAKRDKGNKTYPKWYSYGRSQSIKYSKNKCIYIPCFINPKNIEKNISIQENILHSGCLCIEPHNEGDIQKIIKIIISNKDFIGDNSTKRSGGWINLSSRILYQLPLHESA